MTKEPLGELYFRWLYRQVAPTRQHNPARTYWSLLRQVHDTDFVWFIPHDDNREVDGKYLREEFLTNHGDDPINHPGWVSLNWVSLNCTMFEMLIALSRRLSFTGGGASSDWFWHMLDNIGLRRFSDAAPGSFDEIDQALKRVINRAYDRDGVGGLFPLRGDVPDQRTTEIWYQMNEYLIERG